MGNWIRRPEILVVDDDGDLREAIADDLALRGFEVIQATDGEEALRLLRQGARPCAILLDLLMPGMDGSEFLSSLRADAALASTPVAILTGIASAQVRRLVAADAYFFKPCSTAEMCGALARLCEARGRG